jgi:glyoxylase-like metal-dependent hydrolase (beta-lactamase superfamily II)
MVTELHEGVWHVDLSGVNAYVVADGDVTTLVDGGMPWHADRIRTALERVAGGPGAVDRILVTHYDVDHVGALGRIGGLDAPVYAGQPDADYVAGRAKPNALSKKGLFQRVLGARYRPPSGGVTTVEDGEAVGSFTCYHTPGHTPGHIAYVHEERSVALLGDLVRSTNGGFKPAPWVMSDDTSAIRRSIRDLARRAPAFEVGAPGHGEPVATDGAERLRRCADEHAR